MSQGDLTPQLLNVPIWGDGLPGRVGIPVLDVPLISVGGGLGSFTLLDVLGVHGVPGEAMRVLTANDTPWQTLDYLCRASQRPGHERGQAGQHPGLPFPRRPGGLAIPTPSRRPGENAT
jgi:hypothetical protein